MWLLIDDMRDMNVDVIARTGLAGKKMLAIGGWEYILFDHDLGCDIDGYELLTYALEADLLGDAKIHLVTSNPVGRQNMEAALKDAGYNIDYARPNLPVWVKK